MSRMRTGYWPLLATISSLNSAAVLSLPSVRTTSSRVPWSIRPPGTSRFWRRSAVRTSSTDRLKAPSLSTSTSTFIARVRPPTRLTAPTPLTVSSRSLIRLRAISVTSRKSRLPETAIVMTGVPSVWNLSTIGVCVPSGRSWRIELTLSRISCVPTLESFESRNCTVTTDTPSEVVDRSSSMPPDRVDDVFNRLGDGRLHLLDARPRQARGDRADGEVDVGKQVDPQPVVRHQPQDDRDRHQDPGEDRALDADVGNRHGMGRSGRDGGDGSSNREALERAG